MKLLTVSAVICNLFQILLRSIKITDAKVIFAAYDIQRACGLCVGKTNITEI